MSSKIDIINSFKDAMGEMFTKMVGMEVHAKSPSRKVGTLSYGDYSALIPMTGQEITCSVAISFPEAVLTQVAKRMFPNEKCEEPQQLSDIVGELVNIIVGMTKKTLGEQGYDFQMAIPDLIHGAGHDIVHLVDSQVVILPFETPYGKFYIEVSFSGSFFTDDPVSV